MIGKLAFLFLTTCFLVACADPKYVSESAAPVPVGNKAQSLRAEFPQSQKSLWLDWEVYPSPQTMGQMLIKVGRPNAADGSVVPEDLEGDLGLYLWMPSMGHGVDLPILIEKIDVGTYRATRIFFTMTGDWELRIKHLVNGVQVEQTVLPIRF